MKVLITALLCGLTLMVGGVGGCAGTAATRPGVGAATQSAEAAREAAALKEMLPGFAKSHGEKIQLATFAGTFLRPVDPVFKPFYKTMGETQKELLAQLRGWAKQRNFDLRYSYPTDVHGAALQMMEKRQAAAARADDQTDFERDMLMQMYSDYEWQICLIKALQPLVSDAQLKAYLDKSMTVHEAGSREIVELLKRYKLAK